MRTLAIAATAAILAVSGCSAPDLDRAACQDLANFVNAGQPQDQKADLLRNLIGIKDAELEARVAKLKRVAADPKPVWDIALDDVAARCLDLYA